MELKKSSYIHLAIMFILTLGISALPPFGQITPFGMKAIGVFVGVLYGWIAFDLFWSSLYGFVMIPALGLNSVAATFATGMGHQMIIMVLLTMVFAVAIDMAGVTDLVTQWLLSRKVFRKSPWLMVLGILLIATALGVVGCGMAAIFMLWSIVMKIADSCGIKKGDPLLSLLIAMIAIVAMTSPFVLPFSGGVLIYLSFFYGPVVEIPFETGPFIIFGTVVITLFIVLAFMISKIVLKVDASKFVPDDALLEELTSKEITLKEKASFGVLVAYIAVLLIPSLITFPGSAWMVAIGVGGWSAIGTLILAVLNHDGKGYVKLSTVFSRVNWELFFLLAVTYPIADLIKHADAGIMPTIMTTVTPVVSELGAVPFAIASMIVLGLITQVTHNIVLGAMFMPFLLPIYTAIGGNPYTLWYILFLVLNCAYVTPAGSMQSALVFGNENMERKHAYFIGVALIISAWIVCGVVGIPLGNMLFQF